MAGESEDIDKAKEKAANKAARKAERQTKRDQRLAMMAGSLAGPEAMIPAEDLARKREIARREEILKKEREAEEAHRREEEKRRNKESEADRLQRQSLEDLQKAEAKQLAGLRGGGGLPGSNKRGGGSGDGKKSNEGGFASRYVLIAIVSLFVHVTLVLAFRSYGGFHSIFVMGMLLSIILALVLSFVFDDKEGAFLVGLDFFITAIFLLFEWVFSGLLNTTIMSEYVIPIWLLTWPFGLYVSSIKNNRWYFSYRFWWLFSIIVILVAFIFPRLILSPIIPDLAATEVDVIDGTFAFFGNVWTSLGKTLDIVVEGTKSVFVNTVNYATGGYYKGIVEDTQEEPIGLRITDFRTINDLYFTGQPIYLWADIEGKSFKDIIEVGTSCKTEDFNGITDPGNFPVYAEKFESVQCYFSPGILPPGRHRVEFDASFDFETWSYVTYTFVKQETLMNFLAQDKDINRNLDIFRSLRPVYTPGPVKMGMSADVPQPVGIDSQYKLNTPFGVRVDNYWTEGDLNKVYEFILVIPNEFSLTGCDSENEEMSSVEGELCEPGEGCGDGMKGYRFRNTDMVPTKFSSVTCRLRLDGEVDSLIPPGQEKVQKTFAAIARYSYTLHKTKRIDVRNIEVESIE